MEDDVDTRDFIVLEFASRNWHVTVPESHEDAVHLARTEQFDLYLLDNWMPGISAVGLCEQLRRPAMRFFMEVALFPISRTSMS
jgi:DNA-binding response OmpR family regulator